MNRITEKMLQARVDRLNKLTNSPMQPYGADGANIGNWHLSHAYGGVMVQRMSNTGGGVNTPFMYGHVSKRECFEKLCAFIDGIEFAKE